MTKAEIKEVLDRVLTWPEDKQEVAVEFLQSLEAQEEFYQPTPEEQAAIEEGLRQAERGEFASDEQVERLLRRPWTR